MYLCCTVRPLSNKQTQGEEWRGEGAGGGKSGKPCLDSVLDPARDLLDPARALALLYASLGRNTLSATSPPTAHNSALRICTVQ